MSHTDAKLIADNPHGYTAASVKVAEYCLRLEQRNAELVEALDNIMRDIGGGKKFCGHDFTCNCAWDFAQTVRAKAKQQEAK